MKLELLQQNNIGYNIYYFLMGFCYLLKLLLYD